MMPENTYFQLSPLLIGVVVFLIGYIYLRPRKNLPPGPTSFPLIGTIFSHKIVLRGEDLHRLTDKYGHLYMLNINLKDIVILNSYKAIHEACIIKSLDFASRGTGNEFTHIYVNPTSAGIIFRDFDAKGRKLRGKSLSILRDLGVGRSKMADIITEEAEALVTLISAFKENAFDPSTKITACVTNVILHILLNKRHECGDKELVQLIHHADEFNKKLLFTPAIDRFPFLRFIPPFKDIFEVFVSSSAGMVDYMWKYALPFIQKFQPGQDSHFVDAFLDKHYDTQTGEVDFEENELKFILRDLLLAGIETVTTSLNWTILYLVNRPEIQKKLQDELDGNLGSDRAYRLSDRVPYLDAVIWEVQRHSIIAPIGAPHAVATPTDAELCGYVIPKDAMIIFNLFAVHYNKETWGDPENFRPERFINKKGEFEKHPHVIPFSIGKRSCIAELLARQELYIFTATLFQRYTFLPEEASVKFNEDPIPSILRIPKPFKIKAIPRY